MGKGINTTCDEWQTPIVSFHPTQDPISSVDGSTHAMGCGSKGGCCTQAVAFKPSHFTRGKDGAPSDVAAPLSADADKGDQDTVVAFQSSLGSRGGDVYEDGSATTIRVGSGVGISSPPAVATAMAVRRLTPRECERLQGFPDDYTLVEYRKKPAADGPQYRALGNSMAVPCMAWLGWRIHNATQEDNQ
jgi:DNA (cytosine-5)-methyltransferase 1